jgi:hypothetical protein
MAKARKPARAANASEIKSTGSGTRALADPEGLAVGLIGEFAVLHGNLLPARGPGGKK